MSRSAGISWRTSAGAVAMLAPFVMLSACANSDQAMADKLAAAEAAATRAEAAQRAAERAAATAANIRPAPPPEPTVRADTSEDESDDRDDDRPSHDGGNEFSYGGTDQTVAPDGTVIPGQGV